MATYTASYEYLDTGVCAEVIDFPGVITEAETLEEARRLLGSVLVDMAETALLQGESLPQPDPICTDPEAGIEEPIHLLLNAASHIAVVPRTLTSEATRVAPATSAPRMSLRAGGW